jgi:hypothetical protein
LLSHKKQAEGPLIAEKEISNIGQVNLIPCQKASPSIFSGENSGRSPRRDSGGDFVKRPLAND